VTERPFAAIVMAAGLGTRMRSSTPKHLHPLLGRRMVDWVIDAARALGPQPLVLVVSPEAKNAFDGTVEVAVQDEPRGTGDAVATAERALGDFDGDVLVLAGDSPLVTGALLRDLAAEHRRTGAAATVLTFEPDVDLPYGRIVRDAGGRVTSIVEAADATPEQLKIRELNGSIYVFAVGPLRAAVGRLQSDNAQGELYLTDAIRHLTDAGEAVAAYRSNDPTAPIGVNTRADLAAAAAVLRARVNEEHMLAGVTIVDPASTWIDAEVELEPDATVHPFTVLRGRTRVGAGAEVGPHVVAVDAEVGPDALVGPFCYLRPGTVLRAGAKAGTFVEIKNSAIGERTKVPHLSYIGDAEVGEDTNIAAGNITVNFAHQSGREKGRTKIGRNVRTGVQNAFVAPVEIGDDAWVAAGSVVTDDVPPGALAIARARQENKEGYAERHRSGDADD
jgi:bifunctional UDP-N-acetylglucosamine pyrophosphorylase/glucosamine-1-phosphate N-acetyltransferase